MRILLLNWRDPKHPRAGGAEVFTYEIARRLVSGGDSVEWFSASFPGAPAEEVSDGIRFVRAGRQWTVHWHAYRRYHGKLRTQFDVVIDQVNTIPFFTPVWADVPAFMQIHQLAREVWWYESPFPISAIGYFAEPVYLRFYRHANVLALSSSTQDDLRKLGFQGPITIVPAAVQPGFVEPGQKAGVPTFLYVGRLAPSKRVDHIVRAFHRFKLQHGSGQLSLIGEGDRNTVHRLHALVRKLGLDQSVSFLGRVSPEEKYRLMARSHLLLMASVREGWGLSVSEANACGTPAIVYDVPGLRDAVRQEQTGLVVPQSPEHMADAMLRLIRDEQLQKRLASAATQWARTLSFDRTATILRRAIEPSERHEVGLAAPIASAEKP